MATAVTPLVVTVTGALLFALSANPKIARMGELGFFVGLFWLVSLFAEGHLHLL
jgi:hypothetical protein